MSNTLVITLCRSSSLGLATSWCNYSQDQIVLSSCFGLFTCFGLFACLFSNSFYCTIITLRYRKPTKLTSISQNCYSEEGLLRNVTNKVICVQKWKSVKSFSVSNLLITPRTSNNAPHWSSYTNYYPQIPNKGSTPNKMCAPL